MNLLPKDERAVELDIIGNITKQRFRGSFTVKCLLNNAEMLEVALAVDAMGGSSQTLPTSFGLFIRGLAELDCRIVDAPKWWNESLGGRKLQDQNVVTDLYVKALDHEKEYKDLLQSEAEKSEANAKEGRQK